MKRSLLLAACGILAACVAPRAITGGPPDGKTLGGGTCLFGADRRELLWEIKSSKPAKRATFYVERGASKQGAAQLLVDDAAIAGKSFELTKDPLRFTLGLPNWTPIAGARLEIALWGRLDDDDPVRVKDSWCRVPDPIPP